MVKHNPIKHTTDITVNVAKKAGISRAEANRILRTTFTCIAAELSKGNDVSIYQFGRFKHIPIAAADRFKPNTTDLVHVPAHAVVHFTKSPKLVLKK